MPTFDVKGPDGRDYEVEVPEGATPDQLHEKLSAAHSHFAGNLFGETVGRAVEGMGMGVDLANELLFQAANLPPQALDWLTGSQTSRPEAPRPPSVAASARELFDIPPQEELPTVPQRVGALTGQVLGPSILGAGVEAMKGMPVGLSTKAVGEAGPIWRDPLAEAIETWPQERGTAEQLRAHLSKTKLGERAGVMDEFLAQNPKVSKTQAQEFVKANPQTGLEETVLGSVPDDLEAIPGYEQISNRMEDLNQQHVGVPLARWPEDDRVELLSLQEDQRRLINEKRLREPKFSQYQTPGADPGTYRELLLRVPEKKSTTPATWDQYARSQEEAGIPYDEESYQEYLQSHAEGKSLGAESFTEGHWDEPNVLAHIRMNERADVEGTRGLHLEEVQSDWHRLGRERGYMDPEIARQGVIETGQVPDAPFKGTWPLVAMKRAVRWAVDHGLDQVTWTTGQQQIDRYNLALKDIIHAREVPDITHAALEAPNYETPWHVRGLHNQWFATRAEAVEAARKSGAVDTYVVQKGGGVTKLNEEQANELRKLLGNRAKDLANADGVKLEAEPLSIGGTWAKNLYDKHIPNEVNKWVKKWGGRVDKTNIVTGQERAPHPYVVEWNEETGQNDRIVDRNTGVAVWEDQGHHSADFVQQKLEEFESTWNKTHSMEQSTEPVHRLRITPDMKKAVKRGMELSEAPPKTMVG